MPAKEPYPVGTRLRCVGPKSCSFLGDYATVHLSQRYGLGVRFDSYGEYQPEDQHDYWNFTWEPVEPVDKPIKGICKFLRKLEESA